VRGPKLGKMKLNQYEKERLRLILSDFCLSNMAMVLKGGGAPDPYKEKMIRKMEDFGFEGAEALEHAKERYKYYTKEARIKLRKNSTRRTKTSKGEMKMLISQLK
jgi:hypothetical protein